MSTTHTQRPTIGFGAAALAGLVAGIIMAMVAMIATTVLGMGALAMPSMIGGLLLGSQIAANGGPMVVLTGLMLHMMLSAMFGVVYAVIVNRVTHELPVTALAYGVGLWLMNFYVIGHVWSNAAAIAQNEPVFLALTTHLVFGAVLGVAALGARAFSATVQ